MQADFQCPGCNKQISESYIFTHIQKCVKYDAFTLKKIRKLNNIDNQNYLKFLSCELFLAKDHIDRILDEKLANYRQLNQNLKQNNGGGNMQLDQDEIFMINNNKNKKQQQKPPRVSYVQKFDIQQPLPFDQRNMVRCELCKCNFYNNIDVDRIFYVQDCFHLFCRKCVNKYIQREFVNSCGYPKCPNNTCQVNIPQHQVRAVLGDKYDDMQNKAFRKMCNIVQCVKCQSEYDFQPGNPNDAPKKDEQGKALKPESAVLYAQNRYLCPNCKTEQCKQCQVVPFHLGMTCIQYKSRALMMKCRYCDVPITQKNINKSNIQAHSDICNAKQCQQSASQACNKILPCSHPCSGVKGEKKCLPCLKQGCCEKISQLNGQTGNDYCAICYVQSLSASPSIQCGCGHVFHMKCIKKRFQIKWLTPRILFNFCLCPLCKKWIEVPAENQLYKQIADMKKLYENIKKMSFQRLKFEQLLKDQKIMNKDSPYYNKPNEYALAIYAYFQCFKCKNPYFGGRKNCAQAMNQQNVQGFDPKQLVCPNCCQIPVQNCPKHGKDFIEFKCKFCCSTAQWFCWGNTHFCQPCHKKQCSGDYVSKYTKDKLPVCPGAGKCPIGGNHDGNGEEKMLGCAICRNYKENHKGF